MLYHNLIEYFGLQFIIKCSFFFHLLGNDAYKSHEKILHRQFLWIYDWWAGDAIWTNLFKQNTKQKPKEQEKSTIFKNNKTTAFGKTRAQFHCVWWFLKFVFIFSLTPDHSQMLPYKFLHILLLLFFYYYGPLHFDRFCRIDIYLCLFWPLFVPFIWPLFELDLSVFLCFFSFPS